MPVKKTQTGGERVRSTYVKPKSGIVRKQNRNYKNVMLNPLPTRRMVRLCYSEHGTLNSAGTIQSQNFSANGLYDPNVSLGGHQPLMFDMMATLYNHYVVLGAKITAHFWTEDAAGNYGVVVGIKVNDDTAIAPTGGIQNIIEHNQPYNKYRMLRMNSGGEKTITIVKNWFSAKKFFGLPKGVTNNRTDIGSVVTANPTEQAYFTLYVGHPDGATDIAPINWMVKIDYVTLFSEARDQVQS